MEWPPLIRIYESRLWRRSPLFGLLAGISVERECGLIAQAAGLDGDPHVLDLACGPGIYSRRFARAVPHGTVVGLDLSAPMLLHGQRRAEANLASNGLGAGGPAPRCRAPTRGASMTPNEFASLRKTIDTSIRPHRDL
jgi:SAM-dependent methyltransferase